MTGKHAKPNKYRRSTALFAGLFLFSSVSGVFGFLRCEKARCEVERLSSQVSELRAQLDSVAPPVPSEEEEPERESRKNLILYRCCFPTYGLCGEETADDEADEDTHAVKMEATITAYCPCTACCGIWSSEHESRLGTDYVQKTSSGTIPTAGRTIATDPETIPIGSTVIIDGHKYTAEDTGGGIKGNRIDVFFDTHQEALNWGVRTMEVTMYK